MKKILSVILLFCLVASLALPVAAYRTDYANTTLPAGLSGTLTAAATLDVRTGMLLYRDHAEDTIPQTGGIVRLMAAYTASRLFHEDAKIAARLGSALSDDLLPRILYGEDASALERIITQTAGDEATFVREMNRRAYSLGMGSTQYVNADGGYSIGQYTTPEDLLLLAEACIDEGSIAAVLRGNLYYNNDQTVAYSREVPLLDRDNTAYDARLFFFAESDKSGLGYLTVSAASDTAGRKIIAVAYESESNLTDYLTHYTTDLKKLYDNAFDQYYWAPLADIAKKLAAELTFELPSGDRVFVAVEFYDGGDHVLTLPYSYATLLSADYRRCEIVPDTDLLPDTAAPGEVFLTATLKYRGNTLIPLRLRVTKVEGADGVIRREQFDLYDTSDYEEQVALQTRKTDFIPYMLFSGVLILAGVIFTLIYRRRHA